MEYQQVLLANGDSRVFGWIPEHAAKRGIKVELKEYEGLWEVLTVSNFKLSEECLRENQKLNRDSLSSVIGD